MPLGKEVEFEITLLEIAPAPNSSLLAISIKL